MNENILPSVLLMLACVIMSGFFSATETAFSSLNRTRLKTLAENGNQRAELALTLSDQYDRLISTILIGNNIVNIALASIGTVLFVRLYGNIGATVSTVVVTIVVLIFGEISPKSIAKDCPEKFAMFASPIIRALIWVLTPVNFLFTLWKKLLLRMLKIERHSKMSQDELLMLVEEVQQDGSIDESEGELLRNVIEFNDRRADEILTHRVDLEAVPLDATKEEVAQVFSESKFSRLLVYDDSIDHIVGIVHQKDFYTAHGITERPIPEIMTPPIFVVESAQISELLKTLQKEKSQIAVVLDEYGGTVGIVTMEDILEELVGEIWDEHDEVVESFHKIDDNTFRADGSLNLDEFCDFFDLKLESDVVSLGGWVMEMLERIPVKGDCFQYENLNITVTAVDSHRVSELTIHREPVTEKAEIAP